MSITLLQKGAEHDDGRTSLSRGTTTCPSSLTIRISSESCARTSRTSEVEPCPSDILAFFNGAPDGSTPGNDDMARQIAANALKFTQDHWR